MLCPPAGIVWTVKREPPGIVPRKGIRPEYWDLQQADLKTTHPRGGRLRLCVVSQMPPRGWGLGSHGASLQPIREMCRRKWASRIRGTRRGEAGGSQVHRAPTPPETQVLLPGLKPVCVGSWRPRGHHPTGEELPPGSLGDPGGQTAKQQGWSLPRVTGFLEKTPWKGHYYPGKCDALMSFS